MSNKNKNNDVKYIIKPEYFEIKNKELVEYKGRNTRSQRIKPKTDYQKQAAKFIPKSNKVSPGYKKKRQALIDDLAARLKKKDQKKRKRKKRKTTFYFHHLE